MTIMKLDEGMDTGMILRASGPVPLDGTERAGELMTRLFSIGAKMLPDVLVRPFEWSADTSASKTTR